MKPDDGPGPSGWEASRELAFEAGLEATPAQRLAWLESAIELAQLAGVLRRSTPDAKSLADHGQAT